MLESLLPITIDCVDFKQRELFETTEWASKSIGHLLLQLKKLWYSAGRRFSRGDLVLL